MTPPLHSPYLKKRLMTRLRTVLVDADRGASAVEYGLLVAAIAAAVAVTVFLLGTVVEDTFSESCASIEAQAQTGITC